VADYILLTWGIELVGCTGAEEYLFCVEQLECQDEFEGLPRIVELICDREDLI